MASVMSPVVVGREAELARLLESVEIAQQGRPQVVVVSGEAGIGKSRLVGEVVARARAAGSPVLAGNCLEMGAGSVPYLPVAQALRGLARATPPNELAALLGPTRQDLAAIVPELAGPGAPVPEPVAAGTVGQARLFERMLELLGRLARPRPVVVVVEDAQWIDHATRDLITFIVRNVTTEPIAGFLTVRTEDLPRGHPTLAWLAELTRTPGGGRVDLAPLDRASVAAQLAAIAGQPPQPEIVDRIWQRSEGNPFFTEELYAATRGNGQGGAMTLVQILLGRLEGLDPLAREVVGAAAIAGRPADERLLAAVLGRPLEAIRPALREAVARNVLREDASGGLVVRHELLREVAEAELLAGERRDLHERFATVLSTEPVLSDSSPAAAAGELARHWAAAGRVREAYAAAIAAGRAAEAVHAHGDAFREYERARDLEPQLTGEQRPSATDRLDLRRRAAEAADLAGAFERAIELATEGLELARELGDEVAMGLLRGRLGYLRWAVGDGAGGLEEHREAVRLVPASPPSPARARVLGGLASALMGPGSYEESAAIARSAIETARAAGAIAEEARARNVLGFDLVALGDVEVGLDELRRSRDLALRAGPPDMLIVARYNLALNLVEGGRLEEALAEATAGREEARRVGLERRFGFDLAALAGDVLLRLGRWDEAAAVTAEALRLDREDRGSAFLSAVRGRLDALRGDVATAERRLDVVSEIDASDDADIASYAATGRAEAALAEGRAAAALDAVEGATAGDAASHARFVRSALLAVGIRAAADLAERARAGRDEAAAAAAVSRGEPLAAALASLRGPAAAETTGALAGLGHLDAERLRDRSPDAGRWAAAADRLDAVGDRYHAAYARWRSAEAELRARGMRGQAERQLGLARESAAALGAKPLLDEIVALARRARIPLDTPADATASSLPAVDQPAAPAAPADEPDGAAALRRAGLSEREIEVLRLVAAGRSNGQIAERLFITRKTAGVHVTHILDKLGVTNRVEAAMVAARVGLEPTMDDAD